jgi:hypothetical protein
MAEERKGTHTLGNGAEVRIQGVSPQFVREAMLLAEEEMRAAGAPLDVPQYGVETVTGEMMWYDHNATTLEVEGDAAQTAANQRAWNKYQAAVRALRKAQVDRTVEALLVGGLVDLPEMPKDQGWARRWEMMGLAVPKDGAARYRFWMVKEWLASYDDLTGLLNAIKDLSGREVNWDRVRAIQDSFQDQVQGAGAAGVAGGAGEGAVGDGPGAAGDAGGA